MLMVPEKIPAAPGPASARLMRARAHLKGPIAERNVLLMGYEAQKLST